MKKKEEGKQLESSRFGWFAKQKWVVWVKWRLIGHGGLWEWTLSKNTHSCEIAQLAMAYGLRMTLTD